MGYNSVADDIGLSSFV